MDWMDLIYLLVMVIVIYPFFGESIHSGGDCDCEVPHNAIVVCVCGRHWFVGLSSVITPMRGGGYSASWRGR